MPVKIRRENLKKITLITSCFLFLFASYLLAAARVDKAEPDQVEGLDQQARLYRLEGVKLQDAGDLDSALALYQKAAELDPLYADVQNDLGIVYEAQGDPIRAEKSYRKAIKINPQFLGAYTNLALLYESKRQLKKAAYSWKRRAELGNPDDPWTLKAQQRLEDINLALSQNPVTDIREQDINNLAREVSNNFAREKSKP